jgi:tight adherence protein C
MQALKQAFYIFIDNINYFGILILVFVAVMALIFTIVMLLGRGRTEEETRLSKLLGTQKPDMHVEKPQFLGQKQAGFASRISKPLHKLSSLDNRSAHNKLKLKLIQAGYRSEYAIHNYLACKIVLPLLFIAIYMTSRIFYTLSADILMYVIILAISGFFMPNIWVFLMTKARRELIFKGLPDALDLMVVCVESGLGLDMTFKRVGEEIRPICKELSDEFILTNLEVRAGSSREDAFRNMTLRTGVPEVSNLMTVLSQTSRFGTSLAKALRVHADAMRIKRRQIAEETAAKATVKLIFPLVLFIFPAIFVVLIGPGAIKIVKVLFPALSGG